MRREWRILQALEGTEVPHPAPLLFCEEGGPLGVPFIVMEQIDGFTPTGILPDPYTTAENRRNFAMAMVDAIADLGNVDWKAHGLGGLGKPDGFLERQVSRWMGQLDTYATRTVPNLARLAAWLEDNRPEAVRPGLMHGDYSPFNVMASYTDTTRLAAVIDWDTGTVGDPLLDIAHLLARWTEPGEEPVLGNWDIGDSDGGLRLGLPSRADMAARYVQRSGRQLDALPYYEALALFKLGVMLEGRVRSDLAADNEKGAEGWKVRVDRLIAFGLQFATGERK
jgi:aminoglycoside phosphotransferase (APT) family kinase protein